MTRSPTYGAPALRGAVSLALAAAVLAAAWLLARPACALAEEESSLSVAGAVEVEPFRPPAGPCTVTVEVSDGDGLPVEGASVSLHKREDPVSTDSSGRAVLPGMSQGYLYRVFAWKDGFEDWAGWRRCEGSEGEVWQVALQRSAGPPVPGDGGGTAPGTPDAGGAPGAQRPIMPLPSAASCSVAGQFSDRP